jgi:hypothetical protein
MREAITTYRRLRCGCLILVGKLRRSPEAVPCPNPACPKEPCAGDEGQFVISRPAGQAVLTEHLAVEQPQYRVRLRRVQARTPVRRFELFPWGRFRPAAREAVPTTLWGWEFVSWEKVGVWDATTALSMERARFLVTVQDQPSRAWAGHAHLEQRSAVEWELALRGVALEHLRAAVRADDALLTEWGQSIPPVAGAAPGPRQWGAR